MRYKSKIITASAVLLFALAEPYPANANEPEWIEKATNATVLIKTHLEHGFIDDDAATDRWRGTGFLIDKAEGLIITNAHVAGFGVSTLRLQFEDQNKFTEGKKVFLDGKHDVAVIQIDPSAIPSATNELTFDCDYSLQRGNRVFSLGHPEGQDFTLSFGVLSGSKDFHVDGNFYTTDLVTEPGSSGGPVLLADTGAVIGITTAGFDDSDIGFITRASDICPIIDLIKTGKNPARPILGFQTMIVDKKLSPRIGAIFDNNLPLQLGDEILSWNGNLWSPEAHGDLPDAMRGYQQDSVQLAMIRGGEETLANIPVQVGKSAHLKDWVYFSGLTITEDDKADARYFMGNTTKPLLNIESIDTDFNDTEDVEFYSGVDIFSVGDAAGMDLKTLYQFLSGWPTDTKIEVVARVFDWTPESYSHLMTHRFSIKDLDCSWCAQSDKPE